MKSQAESSKFHLYFGVYQHKLQPAFSKISGSYISDSSRRTLFFSICILMILAGITISVLGCAWNGERWSVRFGWNDDASFQRPPSLSEKPLGFIDNSLSDYGYEKQEAANTKLFNRLDELWKEAYKAEDEEELFTALDILKNSLKYHDSLGVSAKYSEYVESYNYNSAVDRLDALTALKQGVNKTAVLSYLKARRLYDADAKAPEIQQILDEIKPAALKDNVAYLRAGLLYKNGQYEDASDAFIRFTRKYTRSEKLESALFMLALSNLKQSQLWTKEAGNYAPCLDCFDDPARNAFKLFESFLRRFPNGRYRNDARGWLGFILLRKGDVGKSLAQYFRMLSDKKDRGARIEAVNSLRLSFSDLNVGEIVKLENELIDEPRAALAYAYYALYNFNADSIFFTDEERSERRKFKETLKRSVTNFAMKMIRRNPSAQISGAFILRLAQVNLENKDYKKTLSLAQKALQKRINGLDRMDAYWIIGVAQHRLKNFSKAKQTLKKLVSESKNKAFTQRARILLALASEDDGDKETALDQYISMNFHLDTAYYIDVFMTPDELASFIKRRPNHPEIDFLYYSLGVRYLRAERWNEAREAFSKVKTTNEVFTDYYGTPASNHPKSPDNTPRYKIQTKWVLYDVKSIDVLENLDRQLHDAVDDENKAEMLYQKASFIYERQNLIFYNPSAWNGWRTQATRYINSRTPGEEQKIWEYMQDHEAVSRALKHYLEIVSKYPNSKVSPEAMYTSIICQRLLNDFNGYWRDKYSNGLFAGERNVDWNVLRREYPHYRVPVLGKWKPSNRTVDGKPAYPPRPKPKPKPTWRQRVKVKFLGSWELATQYFSDAINWGADFWTNSIKKWLVIWGLLVSFYLALGLSIHANLNLAPFLKKRQSTKPRHDENDLGEQFLKRSLSSVPVNIIWNTLYNVLCGLLAKAWELLLNKDSRPYFVQSLLTTSLTIYVLILLGLKIYVD